MNWVVTAPLALLLAGILLAPRYGLLAVLKRFRSYRARSRSEDALKHVLAWQHRSKLATLESLSGALRLRPTAALRLVTAMQAGGWVESGAVGISLTPSGERRALEIVRAHRLWERHLSDDANMPMGKLHQAAERAEHSLSREQVAELDAHLGHPQHDPHGDPIPNSDGQVTALTAVSLNEWPMRTPARIAHMEDEPHTVFQRILAAGLRPSMVVSVVASEPSHLVVEAGGVERRIERPVAANIHVEAVQAQDLRPRGQTRLSDLAQGEAGNVVGLGADCLGFSRRRLLDLGLTPGTRVEVALESTFGDPRAFRIRGTTIALRKQQADQIWVSALAAAPNSAAAK